MFGCGIELWTREEEDQLKAEDSIPQATGMESEDEIVNTAIAEFGGKEVKTESCPKCDAQLVQKSGKFGTFLACSAYPQCKFTKPI